LASKPRISFEFFPPRTEQQKLVLQSTWQKLAPLNPEYLSVTFGAGGSTLEATRETVADLAQETGVPVAPHISCMAQSEAMLHELLESYRDRGINRLVVLRGDRPDGLTGAGPFQYANELVAFIRREFGDSFHIEVACYPEFHPESESPEKELFYFKQKVDAGADGAGIMPISNYRQLARFSRMCGAEIPRWIERRLQAYGEDGASIRAFGLDVVTALCERLLQGGAPGLHIYTLNRANASMMLWQRLNQNSL
jgi:methylenetetrahydrofolate reductase (NADPH)